MGEDQEKGRCNYIIENIWMMFQIQKQLPNFQNHTLAEATSGLQFHNVNDTEAETSMI